MALAASVLALLLPYTASSWSFSAVPPSTNPSSKLNQLLIDELTNTLRVQQLSVADGRIHFKPSIHSPPFQSWSSAFDSGVRSIRLVAGKYLNATGTEREIDLVQRALRNIEWDPVLQLWQEFGNTLPQESIQVHVKCRTWQSSVCRQLSNSNLTHSFANAICNNTGWSSASKRKAHFEILLLLHDTSITIEMPLLTRPSCFYELPHPGMKQVEAFCVAKSGNIQKAHVVLDPMCGRGTFLMEAANFWPSAGKIIGVDQSQDQLKDAALNLYASHLDQVVQLHHGDARQLTILDNQSVDIILCCPPFGRQFGIAAENPALYQELLLEWARVLKQQDAKMVLLIDEDNLNDLISAIQTANCTVTTLRHSFRLGKLRVTIVICRKLNQNEVSTSLPPQTNLPWEIDTLFKEKDRALWSRIRSKSLPALIPICG